MVSDLGEENCAVEEMLDGSNTSSLTYADSCVSLLA